MTWLGSMAHPVVTRQADSFWCAPEPGTLPDNSIVVALLPLAAQPRLTLALCHSLNIAAPKSGQFLVRTPERKKLGNLRIPKGMSGVLTLALQSEVARLRSFS